MDNKLIQFTNLLHEVGSLEAPEVKAFKSKNSDDPEFLKQSKAVEFAFRAMNIGGPRKQPQGAGRPKRVR